MYPLIHCCQVDPVLQSLWDPRDHSPPGSSRQEYWSGLPILPSGDLPDPGIKPASLKSPALAGGFFTTSATWEPTIQIASYKI